MGGPGVLECIMLKISNLMYLNGLGKLSGTFFRSVPGKLFGECICGKSCTIQTLTFVFCF